MHCGPYGMSGTISKEFLSVYNLHGICLSSWPVFNSGREVSNYSTRRECNLTMVKVRLYYSAALSTFGSVTNSAQCKGEVPAA